MSATSTEKITSLFDLKGGDHISVPGQCSNSASIGVPLSVYRHHMIVVEVLDAKKMRVIHYTSNGFGRKIEIKEEKAYRIDPRSCDVNRIEYNSKTYTGEEAIKRARSKVGEQKYNIFRNNCESFCMWVKVDERKSQQGEKAEQVSWLAVAGVAIGTVLLITFAVFKAFSGK